MMRKSMILLVLPQLTNNYSIMTKTRKTLIVTFLVMGWVLISISFFAKLEQWADFVYIAFAFGGFTFATIALVLTMRKPKLN